MTEAFAPIIDELSKQRQSSFKQNIATVKAESLLPPRLIGRILGTTERQVLLWLGRQPSKVDKTMMIRAESLVRRIRNLGVSDPRDAYQLIVKTDNKGSSLLASWIFEYNGTRISDKP
jgi:hypothetical protein